jgi:hypothetical protein
MNSAKGAIVCFSQGVVQAFLLHFSIPNLVSERDDPFFPEVSFFALSLVSLV